jgi:RNase H-fold protein (predicted Holliday junction resolvase)
MTPKTVLAIDPGRSKCGLALVQRDEAGELHLLWRKITPPDQLEPAIAEAGSVAPFQLVIVGSGTQSHPTVARLREIMPSVGVLTVDERDTSLQAREKYWLYNPRRGIRRLIMPSMLVPPDPIDDFAALVLAERVLKQD